MINFKQTSIAIALAGLVLVSTACRSRAEPVTVLVGIAAVGAVVGYVLGNAWCDKDAGMPVLKYKSGNRATPAARCASEFKSYNPQSGLVTKADGNKELCKYLH